MEFEGLMTVSNGRRHQEVFNGSVLSEFCSERFRSSAVALSEESGPSRAASLRPPPHTRFLVQTSTGPAQRGLRHLLTALCSTMPTPSSSSLLDEDVLVEELKRSASMHARLERWAPTWFPS